MDFFNKALEYIFLPCCGVCGKIGEGYLCAKCGKELEKYSLTDSSIKNVDMMHIFKYKEIIRKLILQYKFNDKAYLYKTFCEIIVKDKKA